MKRKIIFFTLLFVGLIFYACDKSDFTHEDDFERSRSLWLNFKKQSDNSYKYIVQGSTWVGYSWETTITVVEGKVIQRSFKYTEDVDFPEGEKNRPEIEMEWTENENEINTHKDTPASKAITLDEVYEKARQEWLTRRKDVTTYFEANNKGMISLCGYVPEGCMDDCFTGIRIVGIESIK